VIEAARQSALQSPCAKSKRGVVLFNREKSDQVADQWNEPAVTPQTYPILVNEVIAGRGFNGQPLGFSCTGSSVCRRDCSKLCVHAEQRAIWSAGSLDDVVDLELVHVKVDETGVIVAGGNPSCWQCSRFVLDVGIRGVWLYEGVEIRYAEDGRMHPEITVEYVEPWTWRYYKAIDFHKHTLRNCNLGDQP
jgi:hypothetical protein